MTHGKKKPGNNPGSLSALSKVVKENGTYLAKCVPSTMAATMTMDRIHKVVCAAARKNPKLVECTQASLMFCVSQACALGLEPGGAMDHVYFVPRFNSKLGAQECSLIVGYRGIMELARRSGKFLSIEAHVVYEHDDIDVVWGTETRVVHRPKIKGERGAIIGAHCRADFVGGGSHHEYMTMADIEHVRSSAQYDTVWQAHLGEMCRKTVVRRAAKYWPQAVEMMDAIMADGRSSDDDDAHVIDVHAEEAPQPASAMELAKAGVSEQAETFARDDAG